MKKNIVYIAIVGLILWNVWLTWMNSVHQPQVQSIDYELLDSMYSKKESEISQHDTVFNHIGVAITRDSLMIHNADRHTRDSIRNIINPR
jgi:hypothetical protein